MPTIQQKANKYISVFYTELKRELNRLEGLEAENRRWAPTDSGEVRMDRQRRIAELKGFFLEQRK